MSAWVVEKAHIDYLIEAGFDFASRLDSTLRWHVPEPPLKTDYERGQPWGPTAPDHGAARRRELTPETADRVGAMLIAQNERSVDFRYDGRNNMIQVPYHFERGGPYVNIIGRFPDGWHWSRVPVAPAPVLKSLDCYEYQACETPDWKDTEARAFCEALRSAAIERLPGYDGGPWGIHGIDSVTGGDPAVEVRAEVTMTARRGTLDAFPA